MSTMVDNFGDRRGSAVALTLFNLPYSATEDYIHSLFPTAQQVNIIRRHSEPTSSQGMCILRFNSSYECQKVYAECQGGKEVAGRMLHAELGENYGYSTNPSSNSSRTGSYETNTYGSARRERVPSSDSIGQTQPRYSGDNSSRSNSAATNGECNLTLSNLPYSATENDIWNEFPEAFKVVLNLDERGRSRGVANVSFSNKEQCNAALQSCNNKMMNGRLIRGRINRDNEDGNSRDDRQGRFSSDQRDVGRQNRYNDDQRDFGDRQGKFGGDGHREFGGRRGGRFGDEHRDYGGRPGSQGNFNDRRDNSRYNNNNNNNTYGGRGGFGGGGSMRGSSGYPRGGNRGGPGGGNRFGGRDDRSDSGFGNRRDRSPGRDEPVRGYGSSKGPRITSAVINRPGGVSSESSSSSGED